MIQLRPQKANFTRPNGDTFSRDMGQDEVYAIEAGVDRAGNDIERTRRVGFVPRIAGAQIAIIVGDLSEAQLADIKRAVATRDAALAKAAGDPDATVLDWYPTQVNYVEAVRPDTPAEKAAITGDSETDGDGDEKSTDGDEKSTGGDEKSTGGAGDIVSIPKT